MRRRLFVFLLILVLTIMAGMLFLLSATGLFFNEADETEKLLQSEFNYMYYSVSGQYGNASAQAIRLSESLSADIESRLKEQGLSVADLKTHPALLEELIKARLSHLITALDSSECSDIFFALDATINPSLPGAENSKAGLYIRNIAPSLGGAGDELLLRGFSELAIFGSLSMQARWDLEFNIENRRFWSVPLGAHEENPALPVSRLVYWCPEGALQNSDENVMVCSVPLIDSRGQAFGVCGFGIRQISFMLRHQPQSNGDGKYPSKVFLLSETRGDTLPLQTALFSGSPAVYGALSDQGTLNAYDFTAGLTGYSTPGGAYFVGLREEIRLYPDDSPFAGQNFTAAILISREEYTARQRSHTLTLALVFFVLLVAGATLSVFVSRRYLKPLTESLEHITDGTEPVKTNIQEIDALIEKLMTIHGGDKLLPANLFEDFTARVKTLSPVELEVLKHHIERRSGKEILSKMFIAQGTLYRHNTNIFKKLGVNSKDEIAAYADLLKKCGLLSEIFPDEQNN
jgi:DNA-binding CsgD family transcriptional regulator